MTAHTVTVTALPNTDQDLPDDQYIDSVQFTVECPGCDMWEECGTCRKDEYSPTDEEEDEAEYTRHGVHHQEHEGLWMVAMPGACAAHYDGGSEALQEAAEDAGLGVHQISIDYKGDGCWTATRIIPPEEKAAIDARAKELHAAHKGGRGPSWEAEYAYTRDYFRRRAWDEMRKS